MMHTALHVRTQLLTAIMAGVASVGFAAGATAASLGAGAKVGADAKVSAPANAQAGGSAEAHMSPSGSDNGNAQWQSGATRGPDRALEREGTSVESTTEAEAAAQGKRPIVR